ncbi:hypothetical protein CFAL_11970 (plasmid) [Corynebacterium falsenii DSM 44353]|uniref:hypothetical protein n=1 Tax=Corynebacterium falsenii TaxID=108486 RepID=UPI0003E96BE1|nr:hypothetical protein [Corynebacterium falsenii]AHI03834.1 hypothetical protein CFAL_09755 [Corynebacterium falsenii DSM 44353]AHI04471.1 hypothetical protein CFAL_11970 [Corynebacterium falsenii DSM 44353]UBI04595.1 hypothetical protein LA343_11590 [Corynebacterium falsenii]
MTNQHPRTLADMTPEERDQCRGMWCEHKDGNGTRLAIITEVWITDEQACMVYEVEKLVNKHPLGCDVTPRFDLPRAWNADGTPPNGFWEYDTIEIQSYPEPRGITDRRWVSDWEEIE